MLNDADEWPIPCPECGHETRKQIGWLKDNSSLSCPRCGFVGEFDTEAFIQFLNHLKSTVFGAARSSGFVKKTSQLFK